MKQGPRVAAVLPQAIEVGFTGIRWESWGHYNTAKNLSCFFGQHHVPWLLPFLSLQNKCLTGKTWVGLASFPSLPYIKIGKIVLSSGGGWGCEVSSGGHHRPRGKTTTGSALDGAVFDIAQILAYLVHNMSRSQLYLGFGHFGGLMVKLYFLCWNYSLSSGWHIIAA